MTATDELRRMLDERGLIWGNVRNDGSESKYLTEWQFDGNQGRAVAIEWAVGSGLSMEIRRYHLTPEQAIAATLGSKVTGETSDGYHTFNELYHHRAVLFSVIVRDHQELAWKSKAHHDGTMYDGMFIVGIETPKGQATYHYDIAPYWDMFDCKELDRAPEWDGHSPADAIERIATLGAETCHNASKVMDGHGQARFVCSECDAWIDSRMLWNPEYRNGESPWVSDCKLNYCPNCGAKVVDATTNNVDVEVADG